MKNYRKEFIFPLLLASLLLSISMTWLFYAIYGLIDLSNQKDEVDMQRYNIVALSNAISAAESGQRGYLITNNVTFLDVLEDSRVDVQRIFNNIVKLNQHFPKVAPIVEGVKKLSDEKFKIMDVNIQVQLNAGSYASHLTLGKDTGKLLMAQIKADLAIADKLLVDYRRRYDSEIKRKIKESMMGAVVLVLIIFGILAFSYRHNLKLFEQILENKAKVDVLSFQATHDALTDLANRRGFESHLKNVHAVALRTDKRYAVFYLDLDGFKAVNDAHGHDVGDELLVEVAKRFTNALREYDYSARLGGDEFALVIDQFQTQEELANLAERLIGALNTPIEVDTKMLKVGVSIGVAQYPKDARNYELIQIEADNAMYRSKTAGKNRYTFAS